MLTYVVWSLFVQGMRRPYGPYESWEACQQVAASFIVKGVNAWCVMESMSIPY